MQEITIVMLGHKDHGKSTLIGRLLLDTGSIKESKLEEIKNITQEQGQEFEIAHLVDSFREEREGGMTIDTTRALIKGEHRLYELIDVPGHAELISNMITGASGAKNAILIIDVKEGIKEQTSQHLEIARLLGIEEIAVAVNKMDLVEFEEKEFQDIKQKLIYVLKEVGYLTEAIHIFPISAKRGDNVVRKSDKMPWYDDLALFEYLEKKVNLPKNLEELPLRFLVQDVDFQDNESIILGKVESGILRAGQEILFLPGNIKVVADNLKSFEENKDVVRPGENIGILLKGKTDIKRGMVGVDTENPLLVLDKLQVETFWIEAPTTAEIICECGTSRIEGELQADTLPQSLTKSVVSVSLKSPIACDSNLNTILGKVIFKDKGNIIGIGAIKL